MVNCHLAFRWSKLRRNLKINFIILKAFLIFVFTESKQVGLLRKDKALFRTGLIINGEANIISYTCTGFYPKGKMIFLYILEVTSWSQVPRLFNSQRQKRESFLSLLAPGKT